MLAMSEFVASGTTRMRSKMYLGRVFPLLAVLVGVFAIRPGIVLADNPIVQTNYTADPAPMLYEGRLYVHTTHDEDVTVGGFFTMNDWRVYSTVDMVNWTDHGSPLSYKSFSWGKGDAWAGQVIARNGKFYFYVPINNSVGSAIGVAVSGSPIGPFTDALGKALIPAGSGNIDPTVYIDDDGQAYMYWGNPVLRYVKLNQDMISYSGGINTVSLTVAGFGARSNTDRATAYEEGPWLYKRGSLYYIVYPADGTPEKISYTTSSAPVGPWTYRGDIMAKESGTGSSFTNHPGVVDFKGKSYFFYHNGALPGGGGYKRSVCIEEFTYNADGTIPTIKMTTTGPAPVANLNPFQQTEAETIAFSSGLKTEVCSDTGGGINVTSISNGDYIKVGSVDFGTGATGFDARVATASTGVSIELHLDSQTGTKIGTCDVSNTGGAQTWATKSCTVSGATGLHDLFMKFVGGSGDLFKFNWWKFTGSGADGVDAGTTDASAPAADARSDGSGGGAGAGGAGAGGAGAGGAGAGGAGSGGGAGTGGSPRGSGGSSGVGGSAGVTASGGGTVASGGSGGSLAGASGSGGRTGSGGAASGGATSSTGSGGKNSGTGGTASGGTTGSNSPASTASGCSCRVAASPGHGGFAVILALAALLWRRGTRRLRGR
jgi:arabinoxylan arabinofuranohydrolase